MSLISKIRASVTGFFSELKAEITQLPLELARRKKERRFKRTKRRVGWAKSVCEQRLADQLLDEHLQRVMTARICDARLAAIGSSRIDALHRAGIKTAYDVHHTGSAGLCKVPSIGPKLATSLLDWASTYIPGSFTVDRHDLEYIRRIRILKRQHFGLAVTENDSPPPRPHSPRESNNYHSVLGVNASASHEQIKEAYRQRMREYHPDKAAHLGPELRALAERKAKQINEAYEALCSE